MHISFITTLLLSLPLLALSAPKYLSPDSPLAAGWSIKSFTRNIKDPLIGIYNFNIDNGVDKPIPCSINDTVVAPALAATHSWYDIGCNEEPAYHISWGWDSKGEFTVLTVEHRPSLQEAFFGYLHPNSASSYPDVGPNPVQHV